MSCCSVTGLALEMEEIDKALKMGISQAEKYQRDVLKLSVDLFVRTPVECQRTTSDYLPDIAGIGDILNGSKSLENGHLANSDVKLLPTFDAPNKDDSFKPPPSIIDFDQGEAAASLILQNQQIRST